MQYRNQTKFKKQVITGPKTEKKTQAFNNPLKISTFTLRTINTTKKHRRCRPRQPVGLSTTALAETVGSATSAQEIASRVPMAHTERHTRSCVRKVVVSTTLRPQKLAESVSVR